MQTSLSNPPACYHKHSYLSSRGTRDLIVTLRKVADKKGKFLPSQLYVLPSHQMLLRVHSNQPAKDGFVHRCYQWPETTGNRTLHATGPKKFFHRIVSCLLLLYYEEHQYINNAITRGKEIKGWRREKKMQLIGEMNGELKFLNEEVFGKWPPEEMIHR